MKKLVLAGILAGTLAGGNQRLEVEKLQPGLQADGSYTVWVYFTDKGLVESPEQQLSKVRLNSRALQRRRKVRRDQPVTRYDIPVHPEYIRAVTATGATLRRTSSWLNAISVQARREQLETIAGFRFVNRLRPVPTYTRSRALTAAALPDVRKTTDSTTYNYGYAQGQIEQINVHMAHNAGYTGQDVIVLMLDTGYNLSHSVFDSLDILAEYDFINGDTITGDESGQDSTGQHNHGTATFSALAGYDPGSLIGPAFNARFLLAKTEMVTQEIQVEEDNYVAALQWGDTLGADVVSSSLGYLDWYTYADMDGNTTVTAVAVDIAVSLGMTCVTAAGNEAQHAWHYIITPADADSVVAVGAVNVYGYLASFSSRGPTYDGRIKPEVCACGVSTACASGSGVGYVAANGTSLSTPLVAGAAALVLSAHPDWTPMMVREALMMTASRAATPDTAYGWGIIDTWAAIRYDGFSGVQAPTLPAGFTLSPAYPNPFNPRTNIDAQGLQPGFLRAEILDLQGRLVDVLYDHWHPHPTLHLSWNAGGYASGIYFVRITAGQQQLTRKLVLLK